MVEKLFWERLYSNLGKSEETYRAKVLGGWLVKTSFASYWSDGGYGYGGLTYIPDPIHEWEIFSEEDMILEIEEEAKNYKVYMESKKTELIKKIEEMKFEDGNGISTFFSVRKEDINPENDQEINEIINDLFIEDGRSYNNIRLKEY
jgi:hypothetical protein